ncbi:tyrosine recombinase XerC [Parvimonas sp. D2]|uniref:tyrosine recombinase XerC n=1 Tax=unclassified Parvimonas TaxID=1151464 RepID=UPI002B467FC4|nr:MULTISPECIES: tyrosine recombinase XerC [unclassified Parvimonas]MEB3011477.1 tyrosine recombinase XerC [Parvimonas sp. D2]MEB3086969.1 tyrosine recombinase XerC [Parvimonas sp. D4]
MEHFNDCPTILDDYLNYLLTIKGRSTLTVKEYYYDLKRFLKFIVMRKKLFGYNLDSDIDSVCILSINKRDILDIDITDLHAYISFCDSYFNDSTKTKARKISAIKSWFKYLHNTVELIDKNPSEKLELPKLQKRNPVYLTLSESEKVINSIKGENNEFNRARDLCIILIFLTCGLRISELTGINIESIKDDKLTVIGKGDKERTVFLNENCIYAIKSYLKLRPVTKDTNALFLSSHKKRISNRSIQLRLKKYIEFAGLNPKIYTPHKLRHTAATLMYKYGDVDIRTIQSILGHTSVATTQIYTHLDDDDIKKGISKNPISKLKI